MLYTRLNENFEAERVYYPHYEGRSTWEKNWAFFSRDDRLYCVYTIKPHVVFEIDGEEIVQVWETPNPCPWSGGHMRGGACPVLVGNRYYHWFHGRIGAYNDTVYNTGVYTFATEPPFAPIAMTRHPIQWADPAARVGQTTGAAVVFVAGAVLDPFAKTWTVSYGVQDRAIEVATWDYDQVADALQEPKPMPAVPPVYVIHCREIPERTERIAAHLKERRIEPHWWQSIHGRTWGISTARVYAEGNGSGESPINAGQVGLCMGHYNLWQHLHVAGIPEAVILEDDAVLCDDFQLRLDEVLKHLPHDADMVYIGHLGCSDRIKTQHTHGIVELSFVPWGTHGYYVRRSALPVLLDRMREARNPVDSQLWFNVFKDGHLKLYAVEHSLIGQESASGLCPTTLSANYNDWSLHPEPLRTEIERANQDIRHGWCELSKARMLANLVVREKPKVVVEVGVYGGKSLFPLALACRQMNCGVVYGIDPWTNKACAEGYTGDDANAKWWLQVPIVGVYAEMCAKLTEWKLWPWVRLVCAPSQDVVEMFPVEGVDLIHIDGNHSEEASRRDVRLYLPRLRPGGYLVFDDTNWDTTQRAQRDILGHCRLVAEARDCGGGLAIYRKML